MGERALKVVRECKILGIFINDNLKWETHIEYICKKAYGRIWMLRRMMELALDYQIILDFYFKEIRSVLEYGCVVFHSGLSKKLSNTIENVQKNILSMLAAYIGIKFSNNEACIFFIAEQLYSRRCELQKTFARRNKHMFTKVTSKPYLRSADKQLFKEYTCRTKRYQTSPWVALVHLANSLLK